MRNLLKYPLTDQEIADWAQRQLDKRAAEPIEKQPIGGMEDLYYQRIVEVFSQKK